MSLFNILSIFAFIFLAAIADAQERAASQPLKTQGDVTNAQLVQKVAHLQQVLAALEEKVRNCGGATGSSGVVSSGAGNSPDDNEGFSPGRVDESDD